MYQDEQYNIKGKDICRTLKTVIFLIKITMSKQTHISVQTLSVLSLSKTLIDNFFPFLIRGRNLEEV